MDDSKSSSLDLARIRWDTRRDLGRLWPVTGDRSSTRISPLPLAIWDTWTPIAGPPVAFEPPSAGFVLDWKTLASMRARSVQFATITHAAGISSTGDRELDALLPFDEPYLIPASTRQSRRRSANQRRTHHCHRYYRCTGAGASRRDLRRHRPIGRRRRRPTESVGAAQFAWWMRSSPAHMSREPVTTNFFAPSSMMKFFVA